MNREMFVIVYRTGGTENFKWSCSLGMEKEDAQKKSKEMARAGYKNYVYEYGDYLACGVPDTFDSPEIVDGMGKYGLLEESL